MDSTISTRWTWIVFAVIFCVVAGGADGENRIAGDKRALAPLQAYVGEWRGVGQLRRGSSQGAWTEQVAWSWRFDDGRAVLVANLADGKLFSRLELQAGDKPGTFVLLATPVARDGANSAEPRRFTGARAEGALVLTAGDASEGEPARISVRLVAGGDRMVVLYEKRVGSDVYSRLAEVGSTRKGSSFAKTAASGPECLVTGGLGTIAVEYHGKKYFVCCTGCRDLFNDDPARVLADYRERKAAEKAGKGE